MKFSAEPGAYERQVQRKYNNPLFHDAEHSLQEKDAEQAREKDQQDLNAFLNNFQETVQEAATLSSSIESDVLLDLKERLERLYVSCASLTSNLQQHRDALSKLIDVCMDSIRHGAEEDPGALKKLEEEVQARSVYFRLLESPLVADLMRGDEIVSADELIPTLLSQSDVDLVNTLELFEQEHVAIILEQALAHIETLKSKLVDTTDAEKRITLIMTVLNQPTSHF